MSIKELWLLLTALMALMYTIHIVFDIPTHSSRSFRAK